MNQDDTHSNPKPEMQAWIEPELEARVVAWVAGEASAFEIAELERLVGEKPELAIFKRRIEAVQGLVGDAVRPDQAPLRLGDERRAKLLAAITPAPASTGETQGEGAGPAGNVVTLPEPRKPTWWSWRAPQMYFAASGMVAAGLVAFMALRLDDGRTFKTAEPARELRRIELVEPRIDVDEAKKLREVPMAPLPGSPVVPKDPTKAAFDSPAPAQEVYQLSPFTVERKPSLLEKLKRGIGSGPAAPKTTTAGAEPPPPRENRAVDRGALAPSPDGRTAAAGGRDDAIVKLDAFVVTEAREGSARAIAATSAPLKAAPKVTGENFVGPKPSSLTLSSSPAIELSSTGSAARSAPAGEAVDAVSPSASTLTFGDSRTLAVADKKKATAAPSGGAAGIQFAAGSVVGGVARAREDGQEAGPSDVDLPLVRPAPPPSARDPLRTEIAAAKQAESTFSLHVSDVSFRLAHAALLRGEAPDADRIRPEEFYNAFDYGDPAPALAEKVSARIEQAAHPFLQQRNLVRIALKVPAAGRGAGQPLRLTVLLDTSGSMEREDRAATVRRALQALIALLGPDDRITLIGFARQPRLLAEAVAGNAAAALVDLAARTPAEGGTNLEAALQLGGELARRHRLAGAQNRLVVLTDGAANLGNAEPDQLARLIDGFRQQGLAFDACGVGLDGLDDAVLESLTRRGDGRYYVLNSPDEADGGFARKLAGALRPAAENVKLQVRFNAARVGQYRLIGFEQHRLKTEDFRNDAVDAAELAAEEAAVAVYQVEPLPQGTGELGEVFVRFRDAATGQMVERSWTMSYDARAVSFAKATPSLQLAGTAALLAEKLRGGAPAAAIKLSELAPVMNALRGHYAGQARVQDLAAMFAAAQRLHRE